MLHALRVVPWFLEPVLTGGWTFVFFLFGKSQRQAVEENLRVLHPSWGRCRSRFGALQVFWNFALTHVDAQRCETGTGAADWSVDGLAAFNDLKQRKEGCIILTAHMGNYDLAAPLFSSQFPRPLYIVRAPERQPETQKLREHEIRLKEALNPNFRTLYNQEGNLLGVELARLLSEGNIVAVQADRVVFEISAMEVEVELGMIMRLPKGPLFLAQATGAPCFPLFIVRDGWRRYRIIVLPQLLIPPRKRGHENDAEKIWATLILKQVRHYWQQWYVFEPLLTRVKK